MREGEVLSLSTAAYPGHPGGHHLSRFTRALLAFPLCSAVSFARAGAAARPLLMIELGPAKGIARSRRGLFLHTRSRKGSR